MTTPFPFVASTVLTAAQMNAITTLPIATKTASYTAVVGDVGKRIVMNVASANTLTINNSIFAEGDTIFVGNKGAGATTITAGAGVTINPAASLAVAQYGGGTLVALSASVFNFFSGGGGTGYGVATGGSSSSITVGGQAYTLLTFTADDNLVVTTAGLFDVLMFSGGGGGAGVGAGSDQIGVGGGAAGNYVLVAGLQLAAATHAIDIGSGGAGSSGNVDGDFGLVTTLGTALSTTKAGGGQSLSTSGLLNIPSGGRAGAIHTSGTFNPAVVSSTFGGFAGGSTNAGNGAAGGGGTSAVGGNGVSGAGGAGGAGYDVSSFISGGALFKGAGGGAGGSSSAGAGGSSVGGAGSTNAAGGTAAANTASGGGGSSRSGGPHSGGSGGSGICYIRFKV